MTNPQERRSFPVIMVRIAPETAKTELKFVVTSAIIYAVAWNTSNPRIATVVEASNVRGTQKSPLLPTKKADSEQKIRICFFFFL